MTNSHAVLDSTTQKALDVEYHRHAAATYDATVTRFFHFFHVHSLHPWARRLLKRRPGAQVLDVGTGTGVVACMLARFGANVRGVDHSPEMLERARQRARDLKVDSRVEFDLADGENLSYPDGQFDAVTIQGVLHHLPDVLPMLREAFRVLKSGGELYISEPCREGAPISRMLNSALAPARWLKRALGIVPRIPPSVSDHEESINGAALIRDIQALGMTTEVEFLIRTGLVKAFPDFLKIWITVFFSLPTRRRRGDLLFVVGHKP
jgi:ubiquinone/menaquinone biosynthesis C-methylase UbiE